MPGKLPVVRFDCRIVYGLATLALTRLAAICE
jgi:hypothetical protein